MARIDVNPAELRRAARECEAASIRLSAVAGDVSGTLGRMRWQGRSRAEFDHRHSSWQSSARHQADNLERLARELNQVAQRLEEAERRERLESERRDRR
ncbi:MAG: WXG100 family type VII secretion target [Anaerolineales bacterium]|nr:WXG100 family type VII secretion target [Anaerolineales bacterium]